MLFSLLYSRKQFSTGRCSPVSAEVPSGDSGVVYMPAYRRLQHCRHHPFDDAAGYAALAFCFTLKRSAGLEPAFFHYSTTELRAQKREGLEPSAHGCLGEQCHEATAYSALLRLHCRARETLAWFAFSNIGPPLPVREALWYLPGGRSRNRTCTGGASSRCSTVGAIHP